MDHSGNIDKNELRQLFCDLFPNFHRNMLDRYVNDEFKAADTDFSSEIDFEEFLAIYKRIFLLSKSTVGDNVSDIARQSPRLTPIQEYKEAGDGLVNGASDSKLNAAPDLVAAAASTQRKDSGSDIDTDSFFDDLQKKDAARQRKDEAKQPAPAAATAANNKPPAQSMTSLSGLPSLTGNARMTGSSGTDKDALEPSKPAKTNVLEFDIGDEKYEDDFQSSNISPVGQTPRSARSDKNVLSLEDEEIDEEIEEELSVGEDLLKSENSAIYEDCSQIHLLTEICGLARTQHLRMNNDLTTDRTVSPAEQSATGDYVEDVLHP